MKQTPAALAFGLLLAAFAQADEPVEITEVAIGDLPADVRAAVEATMPDMSISEIQRKARGDRVYFDVEGTLPDGSEIELDVLDTDEGAEVVEIQRDLEWQTVPEEVRKAASAAGAGTPVRIIESRQTDGSIIYELFAEGMPSDPAMEVQVKEGAVKVLEERWPH